MCLKSTLKARDTAEELTLGNWGRLFHGAGSGRSDRAGHQSAVLLVLYYDFRITKAWMLLNGNSRALVTGRSLFRRHLSGTTFLATSDTAVPSHSSRLLLKPSSSLLSSLSYLDPLEDFCFCLFSWTAVVCIADLSVKGRGREREWWEERWSDGRRGEREGGERGQRGRERGGERPWIRESRVMYH